MMEILEYNRTIITQYIKQNNLKILRGQYNDDGTQDVIANVNNMEIWHNKVWINPGAQTYFVPIWRNGNTEFMYLAERFGYVLDRLENPEYTGYAFIRHPAKRIAGQVWRGMENQGFTLEYCIEHLQTEEDPILEHSKALDAYNCKYPIDLDSLQPSGKYTH